MDFLKNAPKFSFLYGGAPFDTRVLTKEQTVNGNEVITTYLLDGGLKFTNVAKKYAEYGAYEWVNYLENVGSENTPIISDLCDCDTELPCEHRESLPPSPWNPSRERDMYIINPNGSTTIDGFDFYSHVDDGLSRRSFLLPAPFTKYKKACYSSVGGRSSDGNAPYFNIHESGKGYFVAIGWTGQWNARFFRTNDALKMQTKIEDTNFYLEPGEKIRTSSVVILPYECSVEESFNLWRRFVRDAISPIKNGIGDLPFALSIWGGTESEEYIRRMEYSINTCALPFNYVWMDAGWCGIDTQPTRNEFSGDWASHVGDFRISPLVHPNGLRDVADWIHSNGKKYILWFEPERVRLTTPIVKEHPEYLLFSNDEKVKDALMNLGCEDALNYCIEAICEHVANLGVDIYRQDFNISPLSIWRSNDTPGRKGITEIKHIMGLYRLWDTLLERFPGLIIDNCASGGKRLDIEMMKRSIPLWRSDAQCPADPIPEITQANHMNFSLWIPYSGTGSGRVYDTYTMRSAYAPAISTTYAYSADEHFGENEGDVEWLRARSEEYLRIRPYFNGDIYHLTTPLRDDTSWCATQWHRPETNDGLIQVFKRERSPYSQATFNLRSIDVEKTYRITDIDGGTWEIGGKELCEHGFDLRIEEKRVAKLFLYEVID